MYTHTLVLIYIYSILYDSAGGLAGAAATAAPAASAITSDSVLAPGNIL